MSPRVSVVVTTCARPHLVTQAVRSALAQTLDDLEVVVVLDGPDAATARALEAIGDARVRVHVRPRRGGQGAAINSGIALARGEWAAMLDDDDEWMPPKLERQLAVAESSAARNPVVACRFLARTELGDTVWPRRSPAPGEAVCEYLFCRRSLAFGEGIVPTSMLFARTELFRLVPMNESLPRHCDLDWLVRTAGRDDVSLELPPGDAPLAVWQMQEGRPRMSNAPDWRNSCEWLDGVRDVVTRRAYAGFLLTWVSAAARQQGDARAFAVLLREAFRHGQPSALELAVHGAIWALPPRLRRSISHALAPGRRADRPALPAAHRS